MNVSVPKIRTLSQNSLIWAIYDEIIDKCPEVAGFTNEELHEFFLMHHFGEEHKTLFGRPCVRPVRRSSRLSKQDFSDFVESILAFMAVRGVVIKMPGTDW